jgi:hypothetical protein
LAPAVTIIMVVPGVGNFGQDAKNPEPDPMVRALNPGSSYGGA